MTARISEKKHSSNLLRKKFNGMLIAYLAIFSIATVIDMVDCLLAGIVINADAVSAIELVLPIISLLWFFCGFATIGASTLFARAQGDFDSEKAARINGTSLIFNLIMGVLMALGLWLCKDMYFQYYGSTPEVEALARDYYDCIIPYAFFYTIYWLFYYLIANDGNAKLCVIVDIIHIVVNVAVSILLVNACGIQGLGWGTLISLIVSTLVLCVHFLSKKCSLRFKICFDVRLFAKMSATGSSSSLWYLYVAVIDIVINKFIIDTFGTSYLAPYAAINLIVNFENCLACPMSASSPFVSVSYGENNPVGIRKVLGLNNKGLMLITGFFILVFEGGAALLPGIFGITDPEMLAFTVYSARVLALSYPAAALVQILKDFLPKIGKVFWGNVLTFVYTCAGQLIFPVWFAQFGGYAGFVWGFFMAPVSALLLHFVYVWIRYGLRKFPYMIPDTENKIFVHEINVNEEEAVCLEETVGKELADLSVSGQTVQEIRALLEKLFRIIRDKNGEKPVLADCTIIVSSKTVQVITRDNGLIFDIADEDAEIRALRNAMNAEKLNGDSGSNYQTTTSFNRNSFCWAAK